MIEPSSGLRRLALAALIIAFWLGGSAAFAETPSVVTDAPAGFGRATTGAGECGAKGTCVCRVETLTQEALEACVEGDRPALVVFAEPGEIVVSEVKVGANKTIQGPVTLTGDQKLLLLGDVSNVIIRDVTFHSTLESVRPGSNCARPLRSKDVLGCGRMISIYGASRNIWIDHNEFHHCGDKCITSWAFVTEASEPNEPLPAPDLLTISNNIFRDSFFAVLIGVDPRALPSQLPRHQRVSLYGNLFRDVHMRSPRVVSSAWAHVFNNVIMHWGGCYNCGTASGTYPDYAACRGPNYGFGSSASGRGQLLAENNVYEAKPDAGACKEAIVIDEYHNRQFDRNRGFGLVRATGNETVNGAVFVEREPATVFDPADPRQGEAHYPYALAPAAEVKAHVLANAGPRPRGSDPGR